jgi:hypothetical protein
MLRLAGGLMKIALNIKRKLSQKTGIRLVWSEGKLIK